MKALFSIAVALLTYSVSATATLIDALQNLQVGERYRVVFVTLATTNARSSDIGHYNEIAKGDAINGAVTGPLGLDWVAIGSTPFVNVDQNIGQRFNDNSVVNFFNTNGDLVGRSWSQLFNGTLDAFIAYDANGRLIEDFLRNPVVWSGVNRSPGLGNGDIFGFGENSTSGNPASLGPQWLICCTETASQTNLHRLYGLSSLAEVQPLPEPVPEPPTLALASTCLAMIVVVKKRYPLESALRRPNRAT